MFFKSQYCCAIVKVGPRDFKVVPPGEVEDKTDPSFGTRNKGKYAGHEYLNVFGKKRGPVETFKAGISEVVDQILSTTEEPEIPLETIQTFLPRRYKAFKP